MSVGKTIYTFQEARLVSSESVRALFDTQSELIRQHRRSGGDNCLQYASTARVVEWEELSQIPSTDEKGFRYAMGIQAGCAGFACRCD
jgi:hypothetical protein